MGDLISNNTLFTVFCGPQTHPKYSPAQGTPRYKEPQYDLARGCHYAYSRTCVTLSRPRARLLRVGFRGYFTNIPKTYERPPQMTSTVLNRCLLYVSRMPLLGLTPGNRLRRRPARPRELGSGDLADRKTTAGTAVKRPGPPHVPPRRGRGGRRAPRQPRRRQGSSAARPSPGAAAIGAVFPGNKKSESEITGNYRGNFHYLGNSR